MSDATFDNIIASNATVNVKLLQMNYSEKISVIVPVYNTEKYLDVCLKSILKALSNKLRTQTEILVINDGSKDNSENIILNIFVDSSSLELYSFL